MHMNLKLVVSWKVVEKGRREWNVSNGVYVSGVSKRPVCRRVCPRPHRLFSLLPATSRLDRMSRDTLQSGRSTVMHFRILSNSVTMIYTVRLLLFFLPGENP